MRILLAFLFLALSGIVVLAAYMLSAEDGATTSNRSEVVTENLKQEFKDRLMTSPEGISLYERIKGLVIRFSPYGSNWNQNVRKLAHFSIYFALAAMVYLALAILGMKKFSRLFLSLCIALALAIFDEWHQGSVAGRVMSKKDVLIDFLGACTSTGILTVISMINSMIKKIINI